GDKEQYRVVGIFTAGGSAAESEVWADLRDVEKNTGRDGSVSCVQIRAASLPEYEKLQKTINDDTQFKLEAKSEKAYFEDQSRMSLFLKAAGTLIAVLLTFGAMLAVAMIMTVAMGLFGGMFPALRAVRLEVIAALRELCAILSAVCSRVAYSDQ